MVRIINYKQRQKEDGTSFFVLELQGGIEFIQSQKTGKFYATAKKAFIPSTFDEMTCNALIGTQMAGRVEKTDCDPYEFTVQETGEVISLAHRYEYVPEGAPKTDSATSQNWLNGNSNSFSKNGKAEMGYA